ncbi:hypothetical protein A2U01_0053123, partial [Trifolium medium]|nr:hypothetical protein [Trifolium medium]
KFLNGIRSIKYMMHASLHGCLSSWVEKQLPKRNKNGGTDASQSQEPAVNEGKKDSKSIKGRGKHQQSQMQDEAPNASVPT